MSDQFTVPALVSLEGRAKMIADEIARVEHAGNPTKRRQHVEAVALAHLRALAAQVKTDPVTFSDFETYP